MKTSELLDKLNGKKLSDKEFNELIVKLEESIPFAGLWELYDELETRMIKLEDENSKLKNLLRSHSHLNGKVVVNL